MNIMVIIYQLTNYCDSQSLIWASEKLNLSVFREAFEMYRGRLRNFNKLMNNFHLSILSNFADITKTVYDPTFEPLTKLITEDIKSFYKSSKNYKNRLDNFRVKKRLEFDIHDTITRIGVNITKYESNSILLMDSLFFDDIIEYLIIIAIGENNDNESTNSNNVGNADFILRMKEKKKKMNMEEIKKVVVSIVENSALIMINIMTSSDAVSDPFSAKVFDDI
jgi:hypothetical protein